MEAEDTGKKETDDVVVEYVRAGAIRIEEFRLARDAPPSIVEIDIKLVLVNVTVDVKSTSIVVVN